MGGNIIEAVGLTKRFGNFTAVDAIDLLVPEGEVLALLGPNGAGKTTTVRMLASILRPTLGSARVAGYDTVHDAQKVRQLVGLLTEFPGLYLRMRGDEYLEFFGELQGLPRHVRSRQIERLLARFELLPARRQLTGQYSKGMRQKLALVRAMLHDPAVLFLDEPTSAMDPQSARLVRDAIMDLRRDRRTVVLCTHNLAEAEELADRIAIIRRGRIVAMGTPEELKSRLMGEPVLDLRLGQSLDGLLEELKQMVPVEAYGPNWVRYRASQPEEINPRLLYWLALHQVPVITLSPVARSLEDVYLRIVGDDR
jgi:ABC-2 type transport system ATP-binding protein